MQRRTMDACEMNARVQRNSVGGRFRLDIGRYLAAADSALDGLKAQRLSVALHGTADRPQFGPSRKRAAQCLKRNVAAPTLGDARAERLGRIPPRRADGKCKCRRQIETVE